MDLTHGALALACNFLTAVNRQYLRANPNTPSLGESGVRYHPDPPGEEPWRKIPEIIARGAGDCEDLANWAAAELQEKGIDAEAIPTTSDGIHWHIVVRLPGGEILDPSEALGMNQ